ncbi:MAG: 16S rRNA (cytosine(1402)-N(4))-methyltransferase RsmH [Candidatus Microsyncoccus archaeolyticus]|nr:MAG: 16S rRNA (cytosine(1402)-N(4))-methyltransferase RsmH [Candidatus Parcubacteria bacterium]
MHIPVLLKEIIKYLDVKDNENYIDCTLNGGGHTKEILKRTNGEVLGIEIDKEIFEKIKNQNIKRLIPVNDSYANLKKIVEEKEFKNIQGILLDVGMSSFHIDESKRGFSFLKDEPLSMSYSNEKTADEIVNNYSSKELERIIKEYGQERFARKIAEEIIKKRPIKTTFQLVETIRKAIPNNCLKGKIHFATRTFQALRIETNQELENLQSVLPQALETLEKGGRLVAISFHSLEDRIIKNFFKSKKEEIELLTIKPVLPDELEIKSNPRARSAKLRAIKKI